MHTPISNNIAMLKFWQIYIYLVKQRYFFFLFWNMTRKRVAFQVFRTQQPAAKRWKPSSPMSFIRNVYIIPGFQRHETWSFWIMLPPKSSNQSIKLFRYLPPVIFPIALFNLSANNFSHHFIGKITKVYRFQGVANCI